MPHTYAQNYLHIVFSTKERKKLIVKKISAKIVVLYGRHRAEQWVFVIANGGMEDHAHLLIHLPASLALAKAVQLLKGSSSRWINEHGDEFSWQEGYGAFSVSASNLDTVKRYIANQESHHRKVTFEQEFIAFLKKHKIDYDPRYVFN